MNQKHATCLNVSLLLAAMNCPAGEVSASEASGFTITIHVYNYAAVPAKTLAGAKHEAGRIFRDAGLTALWVDHAVDAIDRRHPHNSTDSWDSTHFVLRLLTQSRKGSSKNAMGEALSRRDSQCFYESGDRTGCGWRAFSQSNARSRHSPRNRPSFVR